MNEQREPQWDVADRMAKAMRESGLSVAEMAERLGMHRNAVSGYLHGHREPKPALLMAWAYCTNVALDWLLTGEPQAPLESEYRPLSHRRRRGDVALTA